MIVSTAARRLVSMKIIKPPSFFEDADFSMFSVFLAGSIEMGTAVNWQSLVEQSLTDYTGIIYNPRRDDWDSSWEQTKDNPQFREQVEWELSAMERSRIIAMYFDPSTKSPISLLELGLFGRTGKILVCCPAGFWRKGNVDIVCERYGIKQFEFLDDMKNQIISEVEGA